MRDALSGEIKWAHAVNSVSALNDAIANPAIDFLEIDVSLSDTGEPIAAHPPIVESDLTISALLDKVKDINKGIKFDFKSFDAVEPVIGALATRPLSQVVFLNADVLTAFGSGKANIDGGEFIDACKGYPKGILSLGWRTNASPICTYSRRNVKEMIELCSDLDHVTFPVRATMLPRSWDNIQLLLNRPNSSLTIWNSGPVNSRLKNWLANNTDPKNCFYDIVYAN